MQRSFVALGLILACVPGCSPPAESVAEPAALENGSFTAEIDGRTIHYEIHGTGPVVMTVPNSWGLDLHGLREMYRNLEDSVTMVYFDPRGMGGSGPVTEPDDMSMAAVREDFDALRRHLKLDRVHAIGWSNGAMNLISLAAERPETLESATFVHGVASFTPEDMQYLAARFPDLMERYEQFQVAIADEALTDEQRTAMQREFWLEVTFPNTCADRENAHALIQRLFGEAQFDWAHADYANNESAGFDVRDKLASIPVRSLVIAGAHDAMPPEKTRELRDGIADSEFVVFEHSGHYSPAEEPERFKSVLLEFLNR
jgi:proline iminopeptidase